MRQWEEVRRAVSCAAEHLNWRVDQPSAEKASKELLALARTGMRELKRELEDDVKTKKNELRDLKKAAKPVLELDEDEDFSDAIEVSYSHSAKSPSRGLVTKTETVVVSSADEAADAAREIETKLETWGRLQGEMLEQLRARQKRLDEASKCLPDFIAAAEDRLRHVLAILH